MSPNLQEANTCCGSICSFEYPLFSNLELCVGLLTNLSAYKHLYALSLLARMILLSALKHVSAQSVPWP